MFWVTSTLFTALVFRFFSKSHAEYIDENALFQQGPASTTIAFLCQHSQGKAPCQKMMGDQVSG
jgi:hypothetical protein